MTVKAGGEKNETVWPGLHICPKHIKIWVRSDAVTFLVPCYPPLNCLMVISAHVLTRTTTSRFASDVPDELVANQPSPCCTGHAATVTGMGPHSWQRNGSSSSTFGLAGQRANLGTNETYRVVYTVFTRRTGWSGCIWFPDGYGYGKTGNTGNFRVGYGYGKAGTGKLLKVSTMKCKFQLWNAVKRPSDFQLKFIG